MDRVFDALRPVICWVVRRPLYVLFAAFLLSAAGLHFASQLRVDTDFSKLIPPEYPSVQALERLREHVGGESSVDVIIESPSFDANKAFAEALIPRALEMRRGEEGDRFFTRVEFRKDNEFLKDNALYFATTPELEQLENYLERELEKARLEANPFYFDLEDEEEEEPQGMSAEELRQMYNSVVAKEYPVSSDSTILVTRFFPSGSQTNIGYIERLYGNLGQLIEEMDPAAYHPDMEVLLGGRLQRQLVEVRAVTEDVQKSFGAGVSAVLLLVVLYFFFKGYRARAGRYWSLRVFLTQMVRVPATALVIGIPLMMSLSWTFGMAYLVIGSLNLMTATLGLVLFGLGIDYGIHFFARYTEERGRGADVAEAAEHTFSSTGQAIAITALSTASALYVLMFADFRGFSEFGFIAGTGVLFAMGAMLIVLPAMLSAFERYRLLNFEALPVQARPVNNRARFPFARPIVAMSLLACLAALIIIPRLQFEYEFGKLEPTFEAYNKVRDKIGQVHDTNGKRNPAYIIVDEADEVPAVVAALRARKEVNGDASTIHSVESLHDRFPLKAEAQQAKLERIAEIRELLADPFLNTRPSEDLDRLRRAAQTNDPIEIDEVPEFLQKQFTSRNGEIGNFVMIYPSVGLSHGLRSIEFKHEVGEVITPDGRVYHAGSTSLVAADMLELMQKESPWMIFLTALIIFLLKFAIFRNLRWTLLSLLPLGVGFLWMMGLMELFGLKLNFYNLVVLPAVLGIGDDCGVHLVHRYRELGKGSILKVLRSTGEHVTMGSLTTMIGFAGLMISYHPGLSSIGQLAVVGIGSALLSALFFLPAVLQWLEDREETASLKRKQLELLVTGGLL